jgi:hypothetical protein
MEATSIESVTNSNEISHQEMNEPAHSQELGHFSSLPAEVINLIFNHLNSWDYFKIGVVCTEFLHLVVSYLQHCQATSRLDSGFSSKRTRDILGAMIRGKESSMDPMVEFLSFYAIETFRIKYFPSVALRPIKERWPTCEVSSIIRRTFKRTQSKDMAKAKRSNRKRSKEALRRFIRLSDRTDRGKSMFEYFYG